MRYRDKRRGWRVRRRQQRRRKTARGRSIAFRTTPQPEEGIMPSTKKDPQSMTHGECVEELMEVARFVDGTERASNLFREIVARHAAHSAVTARVLYLNDANPLDLDDDLFALAAAATKRDSGGAYSLVDHAWADWQHWAGRDGYEAQSRECEECGAREWRTIETHTGEITRDPGVTPPCIVEGGAS